MVHEVKKVAYGVDWCETRVVERDKHFGLGESIKNGVTTVFTNHDAAIIFEDDLVCVPGTYDYIVAALVHFAGSPNVMSITGWTHPRITPNDVQNMPYFDGKGECWVWGTWARCWDGMQIPALEIMKKCVTKGIDIEKYGTDMPKMAAEARRRNLWAIGWWYLHMLRGGLCLRPPYSLVRHLGWDGRGTTITPSMLNWANPPLKKSTPSRIWPEPLEHPECARLWRLAIDGGA